MPKMKTKKSVAKRFSLTGTGKIKYASTDRGHFMTEKSSDRKRKLRKGGYLSGKQAENIRRLINN